MGPKINNFWTHFGCIFLVFLGPKTAPKWDQQWDRFWNPLPPPLRARREAIWELNESGEEATGAGIILDKRKGGIDPRFLGSFAARV